MAFCEFSRVLACVAAEVGGTRAKQENIDVQALHCPALADAGSYDCVVMTLCQALPTDAAAVLVHCRADFNRNGGVSVQDIVDYLSAFFAGCA